MENAGMDRAPAHLWIVGGLAVLWNTFGAYDYWMTRTRNTDYLSQMGADPNAILNWVDGFPIWAQFGWGLGVWMGLLGSVMLLLRHRFAVHALALSAFGAVLGLGYQIIAAPPLAGMEDNIMITVMPYVIIAVAIALFLYARAMASKGVLR